MHLHGMVRAPVSETSASLCELGRAVLAVVSSFALPPSTDFRNIGRVILSRGASTTADVLERTVKRVLEHHSRITDRQSESMVKVPRLDLDGVAAQPDSLGSGVTSAAPTSAESPSRAANASVLGDLTWEESSDLIFEEDHGHARLHKYRTICSEIMPGALYLSGYGVACDRATLRSHGITHIVNTAADVCDNLFVGDFEYLTFYLKDSKEEPISAVFHVVLDWIDAAISKNGVVLVHCREGVSRSATITMAYLMWKYKHTLQTAHDKVVRSRSIVCPNAGFLCQLLLLEKLLRKNGHLQSEGLLFRVIVHNRKAPFFLHFPVPLVAATQLCLDPRFTYVARRGAKAIVVVGSSCPLPTECLEAVNKEFGFVEKFDGIQVTSKQVVEGVAAKCIEPDFAALLGLTGEVVVAEVDEFDEGAELLKAVRDQGGRRGSVGAAEAAKDSVPDPGSCRSRIVRSRLYLCPQFESLCNFDSDDLSDDQIFILNVQHDCGSQHVYVWAGHAQPVQDRSALKRLGQEFWWRRGCGELPSVTVQYSGQESDDFWDWFPDG